MSCIPTCPDGAVGPVVVPAGARLARPDRRRRAGDRRGAMATTQMALLDDLEALPRARVHALTYREFVAAPGKCIGDICQFAGLQWDRTLPPALPLSRHTVTAPHPDKWRQREALIARYQPALQYVAGRARVHREEPGGVEKQVSIARPQLPSAKRQVMSTWLRHRSPLAICERLSTRTRCKENRTTPPSSADRRSR